ncbi:SDR family NAD(P)-dependent oxidoreductase [Streptomyces sp. AK010]|uniref:SDR family NAD(P)-dependent oxidoreductase n=1 Tax=Streptomyces sp. AK010 TaxID=2723074 RepID=UPI0037D9C732
MATPYPKTRQQNRPNARTAPRTVLVTGAGSGIGRATAHAFAGEGAHIVAVGRREAPASGGPQRGRHTTLTRDPHPVDPARSSHDTDAHGSTSYADR